MPKRLALVVDDSKTARVTLKRMLEQHNLEVATLESAEDALNYLVNTLPDVIFMDHMMPGMDGFEAVEAIKGNPDTATIPIMMYTSKEGDLYVSQARALGAIGILPKHVEPAELFEVLNSLGLAKDRRAPPAGGRSSVVLMENAPELALSAARGDILDIADEAADALTGQHHAAREHLPELLENFHHEITGQIRALRKQVDTLSARPQGGSESGWLLPLLVFLLMLLPLLWLYDQHRDTQRELDRAHDQVERMSGTAQLQGSDAGPVTGAAENWESRVRLQQLFNSIAWGINISSPYSIDEAAFNDRRLDILQELLERLAALGFKGTVQLESHVGEFCLTGTETTGYTLAPDAMPASACSLVGHPQDALPTLGERQSINFANFVSSSPLLATGDITLKIVNYKYERPRLDYPSRFSGVSAREWNRIAATNNRVEVTLLPAS